MSVLTFEEITRKTPEKSLTEALKKNAGRNKQGKITVRHQGGGNKIKYRIIDFKRDKKDIPAKVTTVEYDPNRSAFIALLTYADGEKRYILCPLDLKVGDTVVAGETLYHIAQNYGVSVEQVVAGNPGLNPDRIEVGQVIRIPVPQVPQNSDVVPQAPAAKVEYVTYTVKRKETLRSIAEQRPTSVAELGRVGGIGGSKLNRYGQRIIELILEQG